jgi:protochlorophyllide reductase
VDRIPLAVVTGATSGLGRSTAGALARRGWRLVLAVRDVDAGRRLARSLTTETAVVPLDLASLASVRAAADRIAVVCAPLDGLVLNAGVQHPRADRVSADGHELTFAVNHLGHFALASRLRPHLVPGGHVVVVSSAVHWGSLARSGPFPAPRWADPHELARPRRESGARAYATSKLANLYLAYEAARRWPELRVDAFDPGLMPATGLARGQVAPVRAGYAALAPLLARLPFAQRPDRAGDQLAALLTDPAPGTGRYVELGRPSASSPASHDADRARELWEVSEELTAG